MMSKEIEESMAKLDDEPEVIEIDDEEESIHDNAPWQSFKSNIS